MNDQFVTYEIAKKLKEFGFNEPCIGWFYNNELLPIGQSVSDIQRNFIAFNNEHISKPINGAGVSAPLWQQAIDWFRGKHGIHVEINSVNNNSNYYYHLASKTPDYRYVLSIELEFNQCREAAILKALELISK